MLGHGVIYSPCPAGSRKSNKDESWYKSRSAVQRAMAVGGGVGGGGRTQCGWNIVNYTDDKEFIWRTLKIQKEKNANSNLKTDKRFEHMLYKRGRSWWISAGKVTTCHNWRKAKQNCVWATTDQSEWLKSKVSCSRLRHAPAPRKLCFHPCS